MNKILIIENQAAAKEILMNKYRADNVQIDIAETGIEAFYYIHQNDYNMVIVSNDLSDLDGLWIIKYLKDKQKQELILTSMFNHDRLRKEAVKMKVGYFRKPLEE